MFEGQETRGILADLSYSQRIESPQNPELQFESFSGTVLIFKADLVDGFLHGASNILDRGSSTIVSIIMKIAEIPRFFDSQVSDPIMLILMSSKPHDYSLVSRGVRMSKLLSVRWVDPPGLYPGDIRARHMLVRVSQSVSRNQNSRILFRATFRCNRSCQRLSKKRDADELEGPEEELRTYALGLHEQNSCRDDLEPLMTNADERSPYKMLDEEDVEQRRGLQHLAQSCNAHVVVSRFIESSLNVFQIEITVAQARNDECTIICQHPSVHPPSALDVLFISPHIRGILHEAASGLGMTQTRLKSCGSYGLHEPDSI